MDKWIRDLINSVVSGLNSLINAVADRIAWVYNVVITFFIKVRGAWDRLLGGILHNLNSIRRFGTEVLGTLWWIIRIRIPQVVSSALDTLLRYLLQKIQEARDFLRGVIDGVIRWATEQINRLIAWITNVYSWALRKINEIIDAVTRIARLVYMLLTDPRRMAAWVIDALIAEALQWVDRNADRLLQVFRQRAIAYTLRFADRIEDMITRLL